MVNNTQTLSIESETTNLLNDITEDVIIEQETNVIISYGANADRAAISETTLEILRRVGRASDNYEIFITSTARTPYDQARIMYNNIVRNGIAEQRRTYREPGQRVLDVYEEQQRLRSDRQQTISAMEERIIELGPSNVSRHCADHNQINVFDVAISRLTNSERFLTEIRAQADRVLDENNCYHIEINQ